MFDIAPSEMLVVAVVAIVFIGPKDLPRAMRFVGQWVGKGRTMARHFRGAIDEMVREAELAEMEQKWQAENARIMREHGDMLTGDALPAVALPTPDVEPAAASGSLPAEGRPATAPAPARDPAVPDAAAATPRSRDD